MSNNPFAAQLRRPPTSDQIRRELERMQKKSGASVFFRVLLILLIILLIGVFTFLCLMSGYSVYGDSMSPTLREGDIVLAIPNAPIRPGDMISFRHEERVLIKRAVAGPDDRIEVLVDGNVRLNGVMLPEPYALFSDQGANDMVYPLDIPEHSWFVLGDNRGSSVDSRSSILGLVDDEQVLGRIFLRVWPLSRFQLFDTGFWRDLPYAFRLS